VNHLTDHRAGLVVFADDWGRHPSSCQHLVRQLLDGYEVLWVNTIGTRAPKLNLATVRRGVEKLRDWTRLERPGVQPRGLNVANPTMWPWCRTVLDRYLNRRLLNRQLASAIRKLPRPVVAVTTLPIVADLVGVLPVDRWVYYCVDDFSLWPGLDHGALRRSEAKLIALADALIAVSETLRQKLEAAGRASHLLTHGVDLDQWVAHESREPFPELDRLERPWIVFWGVIDRRLDAAFLNRLSGDLDHGTIVLVGPESDPDPAIASCGRVVRMPPMAYERLPALAQLSDVLIMPYIDAGVTRAMQPLKMKEYIATGRPVVLRDLPATREWGDCVDLADSPESFSRAVRLRLETGMPADQRIARERLADESWAAKARQFEEMALAEDVSGQMPSLRDQHLTAVL
jgi:glycosyltransferase involved in cell wall biosynthesis